MGIVERGNMVRYQLRNFSKTSKRPRRSYDKARLDAELKLIGTYGLKNKREIWRLGLVLSKVRAVARQLLTMEERDTRRIFQGQALMRRMIRYGILEEDKQRLDYVLALKLEDFMERRLQAWTGQEHPPCSRAHQAEAHSRRPSDCRCAILHGSRGITATHRVLLDLSLRRRTRRTCQEEVPEEQWWRRR